MEKNKSSTAQESATIAYFGRITMAKPISKRFETSEKRQLKVATRHIDLAWHCHFQNRTDKVATQSIDFWIIWRIHHPRSRVCRLCFDCQSYELSVNSKIERSEWGFSPSMAYWCDLDHPVSMCLDQVPVGCLSWTQSVNGFIDVALTTLYACVWNRFLLADSYGLNQSTVLLIWPKPRPHSQVSGSDSYRLFIMDLNQSIDALVSPQPSNSHVWELGSYWLSNSTKHSWRIVYSEGYKMSLYQLIFRQVGSEFSKFKHAAQCRSQSISITARAGPTWEIETIRPSGGLLECKTKKERSMRARARRL